MARTPTQITYFCGTTSSFHFDLNIYIVFFVFCMYAYTFTPLCNCAQDQIDIEDDEDLSHIDPLLERLEVSILTASFEAESCSDDGGRGKGGRERHSSGGHADREGREGGAGEKGREHRRSGGHTSHRKAGSSHHSAHREHHSSGSRNHAEASHERRRSYSRGGRSDYSDRELKPLSLTRILDAAKSSADSQRASKAEQDRALLDAAEKFRKEEKDRAGKGTGGGLGKGTGSQRGRGRGRGSRKKENATPEAVPPKRPAASSKKEKNKKKEENAETEEEGEEEGKRQRVAAPVTPTYGVSDCRGKQGKSGRSRDSRGIPAHKEIIKEGEKEEEKEDDCKEEAFGEEEGEEEEEADDDDKEEGDDEEEEPKEGEEDAEAKRRPRRALASRPKAKAKPKENNECKDEEGGRKGRGSEA
jgi:hypothetical protein